MTKSWCKYPLTGTVYHHNTPHHATTPFKGEFRAASHRITPQELDYELEGRRFESCRALCVQQPCSNPDKCPETLRTATLGKIRWFAGNLQCRETSGNLF